MKNRSISILITALAATLLANARSPAQTKSPDPRAKPAETSPSPPAPKGDPFVKSNAPLQPRSDGRTFFGLMTMLEIYTLPQSDAAAILSAESNHVTRYDLVRAQVKDGKAQLADVIAIATKSGHRVVAESIGEFRFPSEFKPAAGEDIAWPISFETRNLGATFELEPVLGPDAQICDVNLVPSFVRFLGFTANGANGESPVQVQPIIDSRRLSTSASLRCNAPFLLGTLNPPQGPEIAPADRMASFTFLRVILRATLAGATASEFANDTAVSQTELRISLYSMPRETGLQAVLKAGTSTGPFSAVKEAIGRGEAKLEKVLALVTKSGNRALTEENHEWRYLEDFKYTYSDPVSETGRVIAVNGGGFETRKAGFSFEVEPVVGPDGATIDVNMVVNRTIHVQDFVWPEAVKRWPVQPLFDTQKSTLSMSVHAGEPTLFGTFNPAHDTGLPELPDSDRVWLGFIEATLVSP